MTETRVRLMRQSTIGTGDICQLRLGYDFTSPVNMGNEARARGTAFHKALEVWYRSGGDADPSDMHDHAMLALKKEVEGAVDGFLWDTTFENNEKLLKKMIDYYVDKNKGWDLSQFVVLAVEHEFNYPWYSTTNYDWIAHGTVDLILMGPDGFIYVIDHKTAGSRWRDGKEKARQTPQPLWYSHWIDVWFQETYGEKRDILTYFDVTNASPNTLKVGFQRIAATFSEHQRGMVFQKAMNYANLVDRGGPFLPNQQHYLCSHLYCDHWNQCPYGEDFNRANA